MSDDIPHGWTKTTIDSLTSLNSVFCDGDWVESKDQDGSGLNRLIQLADIGDGKFINKSSRYLNDEQFSRLKCTALQKGDILVARMPEPLGRACIFPLDGGKFATVVDIALIRTPNANHYWLMSAINSSKFRHQIELNASGTTRTRIARGALSKIPLMEPPRTEQDKIASVLKSVDEVIDRTELQINKLKAMKIGMMQELLTRGVGHTEFKDSTAGKIPKSWKVFRQGEIVEFSNGRAYALTEWETEGTPVIRLQNLTGTGKTFYYSNLQLPKRQYCDNGDLLYMWSATFGPHIWNGPKAIYHYHIWKVIPDESKVTKYFMYYMLDFKTKQWTEQSSNGMGILHVTKGSMEEMEVAIPPISEQILINKALQGLDSLIHMRIRKLESLALQKQALMQDLLTGKVRVKVN